MDLSPLKFEELWEDFIASFKGYLLTELKTQKISFAIAKFALQDTASTWSSEYTVNGRWLDQLIREEPEKGRLVKEILTKDMKLTEVIPNYSKLDSMQYIAPVGAGAIGFGVSQLLHLATWAAACATLVPMAVAYPLTSKYIASRKEKGQVDIIEEYIRQLYEFEQSIITILHS